MLNISPDSFVIVYANSGFVFIPALSVDGISYSNDGNYIYGKNTIAIVANSVKYLNGFLSVNGLSTDVTQIGAKEPRAFILHLQQKRCSSNHPFSRPQESGLSSYTINCYLRSISAFWGCQRYLDDHRGGYSVRTLTT